MGWLIIPSQTWTAASTRIRQSAAAAGSAYTPCWILCSRPVPTQDARVPGSTRAVRYCQVAHPSAPTNDGMSYVTRGP